SPDTCPCRGCGLRGGLNLPSGLRLPVQTGLEDHIRRSALHAAALVRSLGVVVHVVSVEIDLHLLETLVPLSAARHAQVLVEERAVETLDEAICLGPAHRRRAVRRSRTCGGCCTDAATALRAHQPRAP